MEELSAYQDREGRYAEAVTHFKEDELDNQRTFQKEKKTNRHEMALYNGGRTGMCRNPCRHPI